MSTTIHYTFLYFYNNYDSRRIFTNRKIRIISTCGLISYPLPDYSNLKQYPDCFFSFEVYVSRLLPGFSVRPKDSRVRVDATVGLYLQHFRRSARYPPRTSARSLVLRSIGKPITDGKWFLRKVAETAPSLEDDD